MEAQPLVTFIIPVYNVSIPMLSQCIGSIRALSLGESEREIIVVDDGSEVPLPNEEVPWLDEIVYVRQRNGGVATARNRALTLASGRFIQFVDGDDMLIKAPYEHVLDLLRYEHADMVMFNHADTAEAVLTYEDLGPMTGSDLMRQHNIHGAVWGLVFGRHILGELRFTPGVAFGEDEEFTPQLLLRAENVFQTTAKAYFYRQHDAQATSGSSPRQTIHRLNDTLGVLRRLNKSASMMPASDRIALQRRTAQLTMDYIYNMIVMTGSRHYLKRKLEILRRDGLYPLPDRNYTKKYSWFRKMANSETGLVILMRMLPLFKRER
ncbi:MAG: glycosyltransferase [Prevotella sp.]|nr:glycosyltransferase [Prevotella sp.]